MKFSIVIPTYKEKKNLPKLIISLTKALKNQKINYEIIFIDDESNDGSYEVYNKNKTSKTRFIIRKEKPRDLSKSVVFNGWTKREAVGNHQALVSAGKSGLSLPYLGTKLLDDSA